MKTLYRVTLRSLEPYSPTLAVYDFPASNPHYAVRQVVEQAGRRGELPRGWKRLTIEVSR